MTSSRVLSVDESTFDLKEPLLADTAVLIIQGASKEDDIEAQTLAHGVPAFNKSNEKVDAAEKIKLEKSLGRRGFAVGAVLGGGVFLIGYVASYAFDSLCDAYSVSLQVIVVGYLVLAAIIFCISAFFAYVGFYPVLDAILRVNVDAANAVNLDDCRDRQEVIYVQGLVSGAFTNLIVVIVFFLGWIVFDV